MRVLLFAVEPLIRRVSACLVVRRVPSAPAQCGNCGGYPPYLCMGPSPRLNATIGRMRPCLVRNTTLPQQLQIRRPLSMGAIFCVGVPSMRNPGDYLHSAHHYRRSFTQFVAQQTSQNHRYDNHSLDEKVAAHQRERNAHVRNRSSYHNWIVLYSDTYALRMDLSYRETDQCSSHERPLQGGIGGSLVHRTVCLSPCTGTLHSIVARSRPSCDRGQSLRSEPNR